MGVTSKSSTVPCSFSLTIVIDVTTNVTVISIIPINPGIMNAVDLISGLNHILISGWHIGTNFIPTFESLLSMTAINLSITMLDINPIAIVAELALVPSIMIGSSTFSPLIIFLSKPCLNITTIFAVPLFST